MINVIQKRSVNKLMMVLVLFFATPLFADELQFGTDDPNRVVEGQTVQFSIRLITDVVGCSAEGVLQQVEGNAAESDDWQFVNANNFNVTDTDTVMSFEILAIDDDEVEEEEQIVLDAVLETTTCAEPFNETTLKTITIEDNDQQQNGGEPAGIEIVSGSGQMGTSGEALKPIKVRVTDADGNPVANAEVEFKVTPANAGGFECEGNGNNGQGQGDGGGKCGTVIITTDANGEATVNFTPDSNESFSVEIGVVETGISTSVNVEGIGGGNVGEPAGIDIISGADQTGSNGQALEPIVLQVNDADGNPVSDREVQLSVNPEGAGSFDCNGQKASSCNLTTDGSGQVTVNFTPATDEDFSLDFAVNDTDVTSSLTIKGNGATGEPAAIEVVSGSGQNGSAGMSLQPITVRVTDADGNPVRETEVEFRVTPANAGGFECEGNGNNGQGQGGGGGKCGTVILTTDANGEATVNFTPDSNDSFTIEMGVVETAITTSVSVEGVGGTAGIPNQIEVVSGSGQTGTSGQALEPIVFQINDEGGNPVSDREVQVSVNPADAGSFDCNGRAAASCTLTTDMSGQVTVNFTPATDDDFSLDISVPNTDVTSSLNIVGDGGNGGGDVAAGGEPGSGQGQSGGNGDTLDPISVIAVQADGTPAVGVPVIFTVTPADGGTFENGENTIEVLTDENGEAAATVTLTSDDGVQISAGVAGVEQPVLIDVAGNGGGGTDVAASGEPGSGQGQTGGDGDTLEPVSVIALQADGTPAVGVPVIFTVNPADGGVFENGETRVEVLTDENGEAAATLTLTTDDGVQISAEVEGVEQPVLIDVAGVSVGDPSAIDVVSGSGQTGMPGQALEPIVVRVTDTDGNPVANADVAFRVTPANAGGFECDGNGNNGQGQGGGNSRCDNVIVTTDANGEATVTFTPDSNDSFTIEVGVVNTEITGSINVEGGGADVAAGGEPGSGQGQSGGVGDTLDPVSVIAVQADGTPAVGVPVVFTVTPADGGTFENGENTIEVLTDENGEAAATLTLATAEGVTISAQVENVDQPVLFDVTEEQVVQTNVISLVSGDGQSGDSETDLELLIVEVVDEQGVAVAGAEVSWEIIAGQAEFAEGGINATTTTADNGQASIDVNLLANDGAAIRATLVSNGDAVTFSIDALEADELGQTTVMSGGNQFGGNGTVLDPLVIQAVQPNGDPAANVEYLWTVRPQGAAEFQNGEDSIVLTTDAAGEVAAIVRLLSDRRVVITVQPVAGGAATVIFINGGIANIRGLSDNEESLAEVLDDICTDLFRRDAAEGLDDANEEDLLNTCNDIALEVDDELAAAAIERLTPSQASAAGSASVRIASAMAGNIGARLMALRKSSNTQLNVAGLNFSYDGKTLPTGSLAQSYIDGELRGGAAGDANLASPWGMFLNGEVSFGDKSDSANEAGFDFEIPSLTAGIDYRYSNEMVFGAALGYSTTQADFNNDGGDLDLKHINLSVYGTYYNLNGFYVDGLAKLGFNNYQINRNLSTVQTAQGDTDGNEFALNLSGGFNKSKGGTTYGAYARASYLKLDIDGYSETASDVSAAGAGSMLMYGAQTIDSVIAVAGATVSHAISTENAVMVPQLTLEWEHEFADDARQISAAFVYDPSNQFFEISTDSPDRDYMNVGIGFSMVTKGGKSGFLMYERKIDQTNIEQNTIKGGLRFEF